MKRLILVLLLVAAPAFAQVPNHKDIPKKLYDSGVFDLKTEAGQGAFTDAVVAALHAKDERWGHLKKNVSGGQSHIHGHGEDSALYLSDIDGQSTAVDFIGGAGGSNPQPGWIVDAPRYKKSDWFDPFDHGLSKPPVPPPPVCVTPGYPGDEVFDAVGATLFADYAQAGQPPNPQMGRWFGRTIYDWLAKNVATLEASIAKHQAEWRAILGLP